MPNASVIFFLVLFLVALCAAFLTTVTERLDRKHYYESYTWVELSDVLGIAAFICAAVVTVGTLFVRTEYEEGPPASDLGLALLAAGGLVYALLAAGIFYRGPRVLVPGILAGGGAGVAVFSVLGLLDVHRQDLVSTTALGWPIGVGGGLVVLLIMLVTAGDPVP